MNRANRVDVTESEQSKQSMWQSPCKDRSTKIDLLEDT